MNYLIKWNGVWFSSSNESLDELKSQKIIKFNFQKNLDLNKLHCQLIDPYFDDEPPLNIVFDGIYENTLKENLFVMSITDGSDVKYLKKSSKFIV